MAPAPPMTETQGFLPISELSSYTKGWTICARVTAKGQLRTFKSRNGGADGKVFHVELLDNEGGEIRASFFNQAVDLHHDRLEKGKCFTFSRGTVKVANRQYNTTNHRYELTFDKEVIIEEVEDNASIENFKLNLSTLKAVQGKALPATVDLCGVIVSFKEALAFTSKDGKDLVKREIVLADDTAHSMSVTLWGDRAKQEDTNFEGNRVICIKGVIVKEWNGGRTGSLLEAGELVLIPTIPEAETVRKWWSEGGSSQPLTPLSQDSPAAGAISGRAPAAKSGTFADVRRAAEMQVSGTENFSVVCRLALVQTKKQGEDQPLYYMACQEPREGSSLLCNKRVDSSGYCPSCQKAGKTAARLNIRCKFVDDEDSAWLTTFHEAAQKVLTMDADEVKQLESGEGREGLEKALRHKFYQQQFQVSVRAKQDTYNGESRTNVTCNDARPVPIAEHSRLLMKEIQDMLATAGA
eukprot:TRINITY_DN1377_c1_g1_i1.p1 TRINITY_DN1377_c1_g1~~TRINITY_DN1377_c1_g1_i1.p1  ORF type:complete len:467 (+),score=129.39 TRINITY_DN1377_c1_g1_i1:62-1462(+)